jgi:methylated-DNA-[protein]-cysteine S-methyltransferase
LLLVASEKGLKALHFGPAGVKGHARSSDNAVLKKAETQLAEYFAGRRRKFDLPIDLSGTPFQQKAWKALLKIPFGKTVSYSEQAGMTGDPAKARAVGGANGKNPLPIIVPCHRVVGKDGSLGGYSSGIKIKEFLLSHEGASEKGRIRSFCKQPSGVSQ